MPFQSKKQSAACFSSNGFGGKVDCKEWAGVTNYKKLPERKTRQDKNKMFQNHPFMSKKS